MDWAGIAVSAAWTPGWGAKRGNDPWGLRLGLENFSWWWQVRRLWARGVGGLLGAQRFSKDPVHPLWSRRPRLAHGPPGHPPQTGLDPRSGSRNSMFWGLLGPGVGPRQAEPSPPC